MSRFFTDKYSKLVPYVPGEQPRDKKYIKLNTNESPFPPSPSVAEAVRRESESLQLYSDPECIELRAKTAELYGTSPDEIVMTNGSDEILNFAFMAFADEARPLSFPDITYGFYPVFAALNGIPYEEIPLRDDFTVDPEDYISIGRNVVIANPNAPTGLCMPLCDIERIAASNPDNVVIIDEAYIDFGGESAVSLIHKYDNLLVVQTFSKSRSMAGARLGMGFGSKALMADINTVRYSTNPYNVNRMTSAAGVAALCDNAYYMDNCKTICETRQWAKNELVRLGFDVTDSAANFLFARSDKLGGEELYLALKERGILIRHLSKERIKDYNRITVGTMDQMAELVRTIEDILNEKQ